MDLRRRVAIGLAVAFTVIAAPITFAVDTTAPPSAPPTVAGDDQYAATEDQALVVGAPEGVLANDPPGACVLGFKTTGMPGTVTVGPDGAFTYTPAADFNGQASFLYQISNTAPCSVDSVTDSEASVTITVAAVNDAPTATADSFGVIKDHTLNVNAPGVLLNDHDVDGDSLIAVRVTDAAHGVVILAANGSFSYSPANGYVGPDAFSYQAFDGTAPSPTRVVSLMVSAVPPVPTPTPVPTPVPTAVPTPEPTATPEITAEPSASPEPSESAAPTESPVAAATPSAAPSPTPAPSAAPQPAANGGGISLPVLLVIVLFVLLIGFGAALYGPRWLAAQRGEPLDDDDGGS